MKTSAKLVSSFGVLFLVLGVLYAQTKSIEASQQELNLIKSIKEF